jgi:hypothetical protein
MGGDIAMDQPAAAVINHDKQVRDSERCGDGDEEITRNDPLGVQAQKDRPAHIANLIVNGNFAEPGTGCAAGTTTVPGWTVVSGNVDFEDATCTNGLSAPDGTTYYLDLTGSFAEDGENDVGTISQTVTTIVGQQYSLTFDFGDNPQWQIFTYPNDSTLKVMAVFVNGSISGVYKVQTAGTLPTNPQWKGKKMFFTATATSTTITFESLNGSVSNPSDFGPLLGNVVLKAVKTGTTDSLN